MKVLIIEDETSAANTLQHVLAAYDDNIEMVAVTQSVSRSVEWLGRAGNRVSPYSAAKPLRCPGSMVTASKIWPVSSTESWIAGRFSMGQASSKATCWWVCRPAAFTPTATRWRARSSLKRWAASSTSVSMGSIAPWERSS